MLLKVILRVKVVRMDFLSFNFVIVVMINIISGIKIGLLRFSI